MSKSQVNFRLPDSLIAALRERAGSLGITSTELAIRLLEAGLELPPPEPASAESRIEQCIAAQLTPIQTQLEERIEQCVASQLTPIQEQVIRLNQDVEEHIITQLKTHIVPLRGKVFELAQCVADHYQHS